MKLSLVTIVSGTQYQSLATITHLTFQNYANKIGAEFVVVKGDEWGRLKAYDLLDKYDRIIFLDTDIIIREDAPSLFQVIPEEWFGAYNLGECFYPFDLKGFVQSHNLDPLNEPFSEKHYYSAGVLVFSKKHKPIFEQPPYKIDSKENFEPWFNYQLNKHLFPLSTIKNIGARFNRMPFFDNCNHGRLEFYFIHYAQLLKSMGLENLKKLIIEDLLLWDKLKKRNYHIPKKVKIFIGGGLGDQIAAEPVVREIRRLHSNDYLTVVSEWPEIWENGSTSYPIESITTPSLQKMLAEIGGEDFDIKYCTYINPAYTVPIGLTHSMMSSTDLSSYAALCRPLPPEKRQIELRYSIDVLSTMLLKLGKDKDWFERAIILHPGITWATRTVPKEIWVSLIDMLLKNNKKIVLIGKGGKYDGPNRGSDIIGIADFPAPEKVVDARNKLTIKETLALLDCSDILVSNDSAPIHLAGATNIWILGVFTTKHPYFVLPYRNGYPWYRAKAVNAFPKCWPCGVNAIRSFPEELRVDICNNYSEPYSCFPTAEGIFEAILEIDLLGRNL